MTVSEEFIPTEDEQEGGGGGLFGIKFTPKILGILIAVLGIGAAVGLFIYVLQPALEQQTKLQNDIAAKKQEIENLKREANQKKEALENLERQKQLRAEVGTLFGDARTLDTLLFDINKIVEEGGAKLNGFKKLENTQKIAAAFFPKAAPNAPISGPLGDRFQGLPIAMEIEGSFAQTQAILRNIERLEPLLVVDDNFKVEMAENTPDKNNLAVEVDAEGKVRKYTDPTLSTTVNLLVIVPKSQEDLAAMQKAAAEAQKNQAKPKQ